MTHLIFPRVSFLVATLTLTACSTPYSDRLSAIDWTAEPSAGTISVSQPRLYRRASLINERRLDVDWLNQLLESSKTIDFKPEIAREVEQITAFAGALGLSFDPAAALNYRRASETSDIQQQIQVTKLQLQLDQLKRDAELVRSKFASQTDPVNTSSSAANANAPAAAVSANVAASVDQLKAAVDKLSSSLATRLDIEGKPPAVAQTSINPADVFRDRSAYRDLLKSARNAVSLDDQHDSGGSALIRLNFQASVVPDRDTSNIPGVIQMKIKSPSMDTGEVLRIYRGWLEYVNLRLNKQTDSVWAHESNILNSEAADNFDVVEYVFAPNQATGEKAAASTVSKPKRVNKVKPTPVVTPVQALAKVRSLNCPGIVFPGQASDTACRRLVFAVPKFEGESVQEGATATLQEYMDWFDLKVSEPDDQKKFIAVHASIARNAAALVKSCGVPTAKGPAPGEVASEAYKLYQALLREQVKSTAGDAFATVYRDARRLLGSDWPTSDVIPERIAARAARAKLLLRTFEQAAYGGCKPDRLKAFPDLGPRIHIPPGFEEILKSEDRVAVYDIGPREQVQQVSSVSRVANNLALAVSLATTAPQSGVAADAAASYSRQSIGKAAALERIPALIGYSTGTAFGWVIGPKATLDPKGSLKLEQVPRTLDLSVDLSVPSWWPSLTIETTTAWAPKRAAVVSGELPLSRAAPGEVTVPMVVNDADYEELTARIMRASLNETRKVALDSGKLREQSVSACRATSIYLTGPNIWRAENVLIAGYRLDQSAIMVSPDMRGVLVNVPALDELLGDVTGTTLPVVVLTRYGDDRAQVSYIQKPAGGSCKPADKKASEGPVISSVVPTQFRAGAEVEFTIEGSKLEQLNKTAINGQPGTLTVAPGGKLMRAKFIPAQTNSLPISRAVPLSFFKNNEKLAEKIVEVTAVIGAR